VVKSKKNGTRPARMGVRETGHIDGSSTRGPFPVKKNEKGGFLKAGSVGFLPKRHLMKLERPAGKVKKKLFHQIQGGGNQTGGRCTSGQNAANVCGTVV